MVCRLCHELVKDGRSIQIFVVGRALRMIEGEKRIRFLGGGGLRGIGLGIENLWIHWD